MLRNWNPWALLVGMQNCAAAIANNGKYQDGAGVHSHVYLKQTSQISTCSTSVQSTPIFSILLKYAEMMH